MSLVIKRLGADTHTHTHANIQMFEKPVMHQLVHTQFVKLIRFSW